MHQREKWYLKQVKLQTGGVNTARTYKDKDTDIQFNVPDGQYAREHPALKAEIARAIQLTASRKSTGPDEVPVELLKEGCKSIVERMHRIGLCVDIWIVHSSAEERRFKETYKLQNRCFGFPRKQNPTKSHFRADKSKD